MAGCCGSGGSDSAEEARKLEDERQARIAQGMTNINEAFKGFNPEFYQQRANAYTNFAMPQLGEQAQQTQQQLIYGLGNRGLLGSGVAADRNAAFQRELQRQKQGIVDAGQGQANELQREIESNKSQLVNQLQISSDPNAAAQGALGSAQAFSAPSTYAPISNLFQNFANMYLASQIARSTPQTTQYSNNYGLAPIGRSTGKG